MRHAPGRLPCARHDPASGAGARLRRAPAGRRRRFADRRLDCHRRAPRRCGHRPGRPSSSTGGHRFPGHAPRPPADGLRPSNRQDRLLRGALATPARAIAAGLAAALLDSGGPACRRLRASRWLAFGDAPFDVVTDYLGRAVSESGGRADAREGSLAAGLADGAEAVPASVGFWNFARSAVAHSAIALLIVKIVGEPSFWA